MNNYELTVILRNKDLDALKEKMMSILSKHEVVIVKDESWGLRKLAYEIDGEKEGYYFFSYVQAKPEAVQKIGADFRLNSDILRYIFVKISKIKAA